MVKSMLTTTDNPFNPFDDWDEWFAFDQQKNNLVHQYFGVDTCQIMGRYSPVTSDMPPIYAEDINEWTIDRICMVFETLGVFKKVQKIEKDEMETV